MKVDFQQRSMFRTDILQAKDGNLISVLVSSIQYLFNFNQGCEYFRLEEFLASFLLNELWIIFL